MLIWKYCVDRRSWILFFFFMLLFVDFVIWLDVGIQIHQTALLYMNLVSIVFFFLFFLWRYKKETQFMREVERVTENMKSDILQELPVPNTYEDSQLYDLIENMSHAFRKEKNEWRQKDLLETQFIDAWVHEVKTPLTSMKLVIDEHINQPGMKQVEQDWLRIHLLIDEQLHISRLSTLEKDYLLHEVPIFSLATKEVKYLSSLFLEKNIGVHIDGDSSSVLTDEKWARFIVRQILLNAVKYSPEGSEITIESTYRNSFPTLMITDNGRGIDAADLPRIFDRGFTGETGRKTNVATGLGLYLSKMIGEAIGIQIDVYSEVGKGTTFYLYFTKKNEYDSLSR